MLSAREVGIVAQREVLRNLRSTKGIAMFTLFFLGGLLFSVTVSAMLQFFLKELATQAQKEMTKVPDDLQRYVFDLWLTKNHGEAAAKHFASAPIVLYALFWGTLFFLPLLALMVGFDQIAGEVQHRTLRYSAGRATRASIVLGKALGVWGVISIMILLLHVTVWVYVLAKGLGTPAQVLWWGGRFWLYASLSASAYVGFNSVISALCRSPIVALFIAAGTGLGLRVTYLLFGWIDTLKGAQWAFPNNYDELLYSPQPGTVIGGIALFIAWGALCIVGSTVIMTRRDV